jgi:hypothetical protein
MVLEVGARCIARGLLLAGLLLGAVRGPLRAAEPLPADRQAQLTALHQSFVQQRDLWSALQIESYARARGLALPPMLGDARVLGDPLFAFPQFIADWWEGGSWVVVWAGDRLYFLAGDGCPISPSRSLGSVPMRMAMSRYGRHVAMLTRTDDGQWIVTITHVHDGSEVLHAGFPARPGDLWPADLKLADDGSAAAVSIACHGADGRDSTRQAWIDAHGAHTTDERLGVFGVGARGAWQAVWNAGAARCELRRPGQAAETADKVICGGGCAVCGSKAGLAIAGPDGGFTPLPAYLTLGPVPQLGAAAGWLAVSSDGALPGPGRTAFYRWSELAADPLAPPVRVVTGRCSGSLRNPGALWLWNGRSFASVDCGAAESLRIAPLGEAPGAISQVSDLMDRVLVDLPDQLLVCDPDGTELWRGHTDGRTLLCKEMLVVRTLVAGHPRLTLVHLERDPARQRSAPLALPVDDREWTVSYDRINDVVFARCGDDWRQFDPRSGASVAQAGPNRPIPAFDSDRDRPGRRWKDLSRLVPRGTSREPLAEHLSSKDVWRLGGDLVFVTSDQHLLELAADGTWMDLGACPGGTHFTLDEGGGLVVSRHGGAGIARLELGADRRAHVGPLPPGRLHEAPGDAWRLGSDLDFSPPGGRALRWDDALGFRPVRLRAPPGGGLLAVTESAVIEFTPAQAALVGRPVGAP